VSIRGSSQAKHLRLRSSRESHRSTIIDRVDHAVDLQMGCSTCGADVGASCAGIGPYRVHGGRRIARLLAGLPMAGRPARRVSS
jgi:hypothetical protein